MKRTSGVLVALLVTGVLALAACGGGGTTTVTSTSTTATSTTPTSTSAGTTTSSSTSSGDVPAFCDSARDLKSLSSTFSSLSSGDIEGAKSVFQSALGKVQAIDDAAPDEIKPAVDRLLSSYSSINDAIQGVNSASDLKAVAPQLKSDLSEFRSSGAQIQAYTSKNC